MGCGCSGGLVAGSRDSLVGGAGLRAAGFGFSGAMGG